MSDDTTQAAKPQTPEEYYAAALAKLTTKQRAFVIAYLDCLNAAEAARRAKSKAKRPDQAGYENLRKPEIAEAVRLGMALQAMPAEEILARLSGHARGSMGDFLRVDEEEITLTWSLLRVPEDDEDEAGDETGTLIDLAGQANVKPTDRILRTETVKRAVVRLDLLEAGRLGRLGLIKKYSISEEGKITIELYDAQAALAKLGEHRGLWGKAPDLMKMIDLTKLNPEQLERIARGEDPLAVILGQ